MIIRANNICLKEEDKCKGTRNIAKPFRRKGYAQTIIKKAQKPTRAEKEKLNINPQLRSLTVDTLLRRLEATSKDKIQTCTSTMAPTRDKEEKQDVVYSIPMEPCQKVYFGETG
uniref:Uncharacterized protein n=1 Tax=Romanomermis culicivorax TaxID=13658 RepID=A0A915J8R7_ROMCU